MQLIDTHVHINFAQFEADLDAVRQNWQSAGVASLVHSCVEPREFPQIQALADRFPELALAVGLHPLEAGQWNDHLGKQIYDWAKADPRVVAIGETGLDFYKSSGEVNQFPALESQLLTAQQLDRAVIIHCRNAARELGEFLRSFWQRQGPVQGVMHCWGGDVEEARRFLDLGLYISFSGTVTFKNAPNIHATAQFVPADRLLVETDCPFLSPVPKRGEKRNQPAYVRFVAERIATLRGHSLQEVAHYTTENACRLFNLTLRSA